MIRIPAKFSGTFITRHFFRNYLENNTLSLINSGRCYDWAYMAYRLFPNVKLWTTDYHAWVEAKDRYWDSETYKGVINFMRLRCNISLTYPNKDYPYMHKCMPWDDRSPIIMDVYEFKNFWDQRGSGRRRHWDSFLETELKSHLGKRYSEMTPIFEEAT